MKKEPASIFNDVIGPVMRGPSSSHTAAATRIGKLARQMIKGTLKTVLVEFDPNGSLATTYHGHGSDIGLVGGLLGYEPQDERLPHALSIAREIGLAVTFSVVPYEAPHPNTYRMKMTSDLNETVFLTAISTGGGMIVIEKIQNCPTMITGGYYETLIFRDKTAPYWNIEECFSLNKISIEDQKKSESEEYILLDIKTTTPIPKDIINQIQEKSGICDVICLSPILPTHSSKNCHVPFLTAKDMLTKNKENKKLWELAVDYESARGNMPPSEVFQTMKHLVSLMSQSIEEGLKGTNYPNRLLGSQSTLFNEQDLGNKLLPGTVMNKVIQYITSMMEVKSSMGVIVAAPTAGSCGGLPGTILGASVAMNRSMDDATKAMLSAGIIGLFIAEHATFAAEVGGCQVECGAGSSMAAAGLVELMGGSAQEAVDAASMALQNVMGMVCDPVADRVEVPCLGKNVMAGVNAIACANMSLVGYDKVIPLDETIDSMYKVGQMLPPELRCTGNGGLSVTPTGQQLYRKFNP